MKRDLVVASNRHHHTRLLKYYTRRPCMPSFVKSRMLRPLQTHILFFQQIFFVLVCIPLGTPRVPPRILASGPKPCVGNNGLFFFLWDSWYDITFNICFLWLTCKLLRPYHAWNMWTQLRPEGCFCFHWLSLWIHLHQNADQRIVNMYPQERYLFSQCTSLPRNTETFRQTHLIKYGGGRLAWTNLPSREVAIIQKGEVLIYEAVFT